MGGLYYTTRDNGLGIKATKKTPLLARRGGPDRAKRLSGPGWWKQKNNFGYFQKKCHFFKLM
jgi:hypothetical protein